MDYSELTKNSIFIEVGSFKNYGGWVLDTQFIMNMGSAYLLAHGLGIPVSDAETTVTPPLAGSYRLWAFTKDWVAHWKKNCAPGLFKVRINEAECPAVFGSYGEEWQWQDGGVVEIPSAAIHISLHDLTGFEGRCGGLFLTQDLNFSPPDNIEELGKLRRVLCKHENIDFLGNYDIAVAGGGFSGMCTAVTAARKGLRVALIQDRDVFGGNNSSEVRVWLGGETNFEPFPNIGNITREFEQKKKAHYGAENIGEIYEDEKKAYIIRNEKNIDIFTGLFLIDAITSNDMIESVVVYDVKTGAYGRISAQLYADCTGDGNLGYFAGAHFEVTTNGHMGMTNIWNIKDCGFELPFPECPWAIDLSCVDFPGRKDTKDIYGQKREVSLGCWFWESGMEHDPIKMAEYARDTNFRAMYGAFDCVKNIDHDYKNFKLNFCAYIGGKRESRRLLGDIILTKSDVFTETVFPDAVIPSTWNFDVHYPDRRFYSAFHEGDGFITHDYHENFKSPYFLPYRCLYSRNIHNLFMAGRDISVSHDASGTARVMRTCGMMGEVVGKAAFICQKHGISPREVYTDYLNDLLDLCRQK